MSCRVVSCRVCVVVLCRSVLVHLLCAHHACVVFRRRIQHHMHRQRSHLFRYNHNICALCKHINNNKQQQTTTAAREGHQARGCAHRDVCVAYNASACRTMHELDAMLSRVCVCVVAVLCLLTCSVAFRKHRYPAAFPIPHAHTHTRRTRTHADISPHDDIGLTHSHMTSHILTQTWMRIRSIIPTRVSMSRSLRMSSHVDGWL